MCGRFTLRTPLSVLAQQFLFDLTGDGAAGAISAAYRPRYNIAPTQTILAVRATAADAVGASGGEQSTSAHSRTLAAFRWGLIPSWAKDEQIAYSTINARADTVATKPAFRAAFKKRRCLILADGYYEWKAVGKTKQPCLFHFPHDRPFALAGLWESWQPPGNAGPPLETCTIITTDANAVAQQVHNRMPVILSVDDCITWLNPALQTADELQHLLQSYPDDELTVSEADPYVNNARHEGPECLGSPGETR